MEWCEVEKLIRKKHHILNLLQAAKSQVGIIKHKSWTKSILSTSCSREICMMSPPAYAYDVKFKIKSNFYLGRMMHFLLCFFIAYD